MSNHITHLSFTRLKELAHSPLALKRYIEETKKSTRAMDEGTLLDCLLFEPDTFDTRFFVMPEGLKKPTKAQLEAKKPSPESVAQIAAWKTMQASINGRITITEEQKQEAEFLAESVRNNSTVTFQGLLHPDNFNFQVPVDFFYKGFKHRGIKDAHGVDRNGRAVIWDLKRMAGRSGEALVRAQIRANKYDLQAAIYCHPYDIEGLPIEYYIIAVDNEGYVTPFRISKDAREKAAWEWRKLIAAAHRCNMEGLEMGCEFWGDSDGFFNM
jgi:hypothetical protein